MKKTIQVLNRLRSRGLVQDYAIGGAIAAMRYLEPSVTDDLDVYIHLSPGSGSIVTLTPIYDHLKVLGYPEFKREGILIGKWPVQFLPVSSPLEEEAFQQAVEDKIEGEPVRVFRAEHLMTLCLNLGRQKDRARLAQFLEEGAYDAKKLMEILCCHGLQAKWKNFVLLMQKDAR